MILYRIRAKTWLAQHRRSFQLRTKHDVVTEWGGPLSRSNWRCLKISVSRSSLLCSIKIPVHPRVSGMQHVSFAIKKQMLISKGLNTRKPNSKAKTEGDSACVSYWFSENEKRSHFAPDGTSSSFCLQQWTSSKLELLYDESMSLTPERNLHIVKLLIVSMHRHKWFTRSLFQGLQLSLCYFQLLLVPLFMYMI